MASSSKKRAPSKSHSITPVDDDSKTLGEVLHHSTKNRKKNKKPTELLLIPNNENQISDSNYETPDQIIYRTTCLCDTHFNKRLLEHNYHLTVDKLFDLIFGSNEFVRTYRQAQRFYDDTASEWIINEETNQRERTLKYKVPYESTFVGKGTIFTREKQTIIHEVPGSHYTLEADVYNEGVKYCDTFSLIIRFCLVQTSSTTTNLCVTAQILYHKPVMGIVKPLIERNAYSASQEGLKDLNNRLNLLVDYQINKHHSNQNEVPVSVPTPEIVRRLSQHEIPTVDQVFSNVNPNIEPIDPDRLTYIIIFLVGILFFIHLHLYIKLSQMEYLLDRIIHLL